MRDPEAGPSARPRKSRLTRPASAPARRLGGSAMSGQTFWRLATGAAMFLLAVLLVALVARRSVAIVVEPAAGATAAGVAAVCGGLGGWRCRGDERRWRWLTGSAATVTMVGVAAAAWSTAVSGTNVPRLHLSDLGYLVCYALALAGLLTMPTDPLDHGPDGLAGREGRDRHRSVSSRRWLVVTVLDSLLLVGSLALLGWDLVVEDVVVGRGHGLVALLMAWVLALAALVLIVAVFLVGTFRRPRSWLAFSLLAAGLVLLAVVATTYAAAAVRRWVVVPPPISAGFVAALLLVGLATVVPARPTSLLAVDAGDVDVRDADVSEVDVSDREGGRRPGRLQVLHLMLPYLPLGAVGLLAVVRLVESAQIQRDEMLVLFFLLALALVRQVCTLLENANLLARYRASQRQLRYQAFHDPLTGLANRALFGQRLRAALERRARDGDPRSLAVLFCDLDDFKIVNDALGHGAGDELLRVTAARLAAAVRSVDTVARLGGDEFAILAEGGGDDPRQLGRRVADAVAAPCVLAGAPYTVRGSVGLAIVEPGGAADPETVIHQADLAMYEAKRAGGAVTVYQPGLSGPDSGRRRAPRAPGRYP
ncbi:GGDEF domain-containing protein [Frankia nepalensis]|uniref:GGDEF domain-containing protein n=1 Tax=Frankia nepalensis TaxID=1836974 RepID=A0A937UTQ5_9ACTN|nr:GGDEF domain-containing protein [Frankia nepalensis]MBL7500618.1 GGDEF domain-containing protein [Frankia nepalensis]MBL7510981.1 GGDEF domain-containing protein [Frankia nepalensis]MBL7630286.1 GGDEF domain-containing protein [Frankia nepalensis]